MSKAAALRKQAEQNSVILKESDQALAGQKRQKNDASPVGTPKKAPAKRPRPEALKQVASEKNLAEKPLVFQSKTGKTKVATAAAAPAGAVAVAPAKAASKKEASPRKSPRSQKKRPAVEDKGKEEEEEKEEKEGKPGAEDAPIALEQFLMELEKLGSNSRADRVFVECLARFRDKARGACGPQASRAVALLEECAERLEAELRRTAQLPLPGEAAAEEAELLPAERARLAELRREWPASSEVAQAYADSGVVIQQFSDQVQQLSNISDAIQTRLEELAAGAMAEATPGKSAKKSKTRK